MLAPPDGAMFEANGLIGDNTSCQRLVWAMRRDPLGAAELIRVPSRPRRRRRP